MVHTLLIEPTWNNESGVAAHPGPPVQDSGRQLQARLVRTEPQHPQRGAGYVVPSGEVVEPCLPVRRVHGPMLPERVVGGQV